MKEAVQSCKAIVSFADTVGLNVIAEGIEHEEQVEYFKGIRLSGRTRIFLQ